MPILPALSALGLISLANVLIYSGVAFLNQQLLASRLGAVYGLLPAQWMRLIFGLVVFFGPANLLVSAAYRHVPAVWVGVLIVVTTVVAIIVMALVLDQARLTLTIVGGAALMAVGAAIVVVGFDLQGTRS